MMLEKLLITSQIALAITQCYQIIWMVEQSKRLGQNTKIVTRIEEEITERLDGRK